MLDTGEVLPAEKKYHHNRTRDLALAFWDGSSHGTKYVIEKCEEMGVEVRIYKKDMEIGCYNNRSPYHLGKGIICITAVNKQDFASMMSQLSVMSCYLYRMFGI